MSDNRMKKDIAMEDGTYYSEQPKEAVSIAEIDKVIKKLKLQHSITMVTLNIAIFFMLAFNAFAVALLMGWLQ